MLCTHSDLNSWQIVAISSFLAARSEATSLILMSSWSVRARSSSILMFSLKPFCAIVIIGCKLWPMARYCFLAVLPSVMLVPCRACSSLLMSGTDSSGTQVNNKRRTDNER